MAGSTGGAGRDAQAVRVGERTLRLTNPDKVLFPGSDPGALGTTKAELIDYYLRIAPVLLPHLDGRIVTRKRWPHGTAEGQQPFFTKNLDSGTPDWVPRAAVVHHQRTNTYPLLEEEAALAWCAQLGSIELHVPQWRLPDPVRAGEESFVLDGADTRPDRLVVDLDPGPGVGLAECCEVALAARDLMAAVGLTCVPVTSGSKGIHLYAHLQDLGAADASAFAAELATSLAAELPRLAIVQMKRSLREGKVFVDHTQNNAAKTTVSPYSVRGRLEPWVAAPRTWAEVETGGLRQLRIEEVLERAADGDPLAALAPAPAPTPTREARLQPPRGGSAGPGSRAAAPAVATRPTSRRRAPEPMLASGYDPLSVDITPERWRLEHKWDGYRALVVLTGRPDGAARLVSRTGREIGAEFPELLTPPEQLVAHEGVLDAEIVALAGDQVSFHALQHRDSPPRPPLRLVIFDVLELDDVDLTGQPLSARTEVLAALDLPAADHAPGEPLPAGEGGWLTSPALPGSLAAALEASHAVGGEGVMAKRLDARYLTGRRSPAWVKVKHQAEARVVVGGWRPGQGRREGGIGSLLLGIAGEGDHLRYVGKVGTGFTDAELDRLFALLDPLRAEVSPFTTPVPAPEARVAVWVRPEVAGEVTFDSWTPDGVLRAARWRGLS